MLFRTRAHKIYRDVAARKARTAMVSLSIFIGVLGVVTLASLGDLMVAKLRHDLDENRLAMVFAFVSLDDNADEAAVDDTAALETLRAYPGVTVVEGWIRQTVYWNKPGETGFIDGALRAFSEPFEDKTIEPTQLVEGAYPRPGQQQLAIERRMAQRYDLRVGDSITIRILGQLRGRPGAAADIPEETWTISGIVFHPYIGDSSATSLYAAMPDLTYITGSAHFNLFQARFTDFAAADAAADDFEQFINIQTPFEVDFLEISDPARNELIQEVSNWTNTLTALAVIAMLVSGFLVVTVISTIVIEQRRQIGVLKSLGATRPDNIFIYSGIAVVYGIIGTLPAVLLGIPLGFYLTKTLAPLFNILIEDFTISYTAVLAGAFMGLMMPFAASILPVFLGTRVTILEAMTDLGISSRYGYGLVARLIRRLPVPAAVRQALANVYQKRGRLALTGFTLTLAVGAFMGITALFMSLGNAVNTIFDTFHYDLLVVPTQPEDYDYDAVGALIHESVEGISGVYPSYGTGVQILTGETGPDGTELTRFMPVNGFDTRTDSIRFNLQAGSAWQDDPDREGIVITRSLADALGKHVGDRITVRLEGETETTDLEIIGIDSLPFDIGFTRWQTAAALDGETRPRGYLLRFADPDIAAAEVDRQIGSIRELLLRNGILAFFDNQVADAEENASLILTGGIVFNIASLVMAAIGAIGLLTMLFISVFERQREIGVMRSVGASSYAVAGQFLVEGLVVGVIAWALGVPLSYALGSFLTSILPISEFGFRYPPVTIVIGLAGMLVIAALASLWPSLSAARRTVSDILRYQ